jgi:NAD(P)-dependent dehydrogenase (short-subunit alcohol dehydrogenase family)
MSDGTIALQLPPQPTGMRMLAGKRVLVTAAAGTGIGSSVARRALEEGASVVISDAHERRLGETLPPHAEAVMGALLVGVCDPCASVRHSCLGGLADVAATLRLALHPWAVELLQVTGAALEGETDAAARRAACYLLGLLLQSLGTDALTVLSPRQLTAIYRRLKILRGGAAQADPKLLGHVDAALEQMRQLGLALVRGRGSSLENGPVLWGSEGESTMEPEGILRSMERLRLSLA